MKLKDALKLSFRTLKINKMRSALTMLGIVIGVGSVILMMSLGNGAQNLVVGQVASMGSNNIYIELGSPAGSMSQQVIDQLGKVNLKASDAEAIAKNPNVEKVSSMIYGNGIASYLGEDKKITFMGIDEEAMDISNLSIADGRSIQR